MNCPVCVNERLVITDRNGIEIDYCPKCRGVWLDRGELDKIIERAENAYRGSQREEPRYEKRDHGYDRGGYEPKHHYKKKESFWSELFD